MKNLKKVLALVLAFAMAFTMMATAGAAYTDQADIEATEAVEMLATLGVMTGDPDGSFRPNDTITRAEACRMIYSIRTNSDDASAYAGMQTTFTDVPSDAWYAGYVKHCQSVGIVSGKSATIFDPNANVTGVELALMCLRVIGYDPAKADIGGSTWSTTTIGLATEAGILEDVNTSITADCPRQWAAQLMYNMIQAHTVRWSNDSESYTDLNMAGTRYNETVGVKYLDLWINIGTLTGIDADKLTITMNQNDNLESDKKITIAQNSTQGTLDFTKLSKDYTDLLGQKVKVLFKDGKTNSVIGVYATEENTVYSTVMNAVEVDDNGKIKFGGTSYSTDNMLALYVVNENGLNPAVTVNKADFDNDVNSKVVAGRDVNRISADEVTFIDSDEDGKIDTALLFTVDYGKVTYVGSDNIYVSSTNDPDRTDEYELEDNEIAEDIEKNDYVTIKWSCFGDCWAIEKADELTGVTMDATKADPDQWRIDGTWYVENRTNTDTVQVGNTIDAFVANGVVLYAKRTSGENAAIADVAMVVAKGANIEGDKVKIVDFDGNEQIVSIDTDAKTADGYVEKGTLTPGAVYELETSGDKYRFKHLKGDPDFYGDYTALNIGVQGANKTVTKDDGDFVFTYAAGKTAKVDDSAKVFIITGAGDTFDYKLITGKQFNSLGLSTEDKTTDEVMADGFVTGFTAKVSGVTRVTNAVAQVESIGSAFETNENYGYITSDAAKLTGGYIEYTVWNGSEDVTVTEKKSDTVNRVKGTIIGYSAITDGEIKDVAKIDVIEAAIQGVDVESERPGKVSFDGSTQFDVTNDTVILFVDTKNHKGVAGGTVTEADKVGGVYVKNAYYTEDAGDLNVLVVDTRNRLDSVAVTFAGANPSAADINEALKMGDVVVEQKITTGTINVPAEVSLQLKTMPANGVAVKAAKGAEVIFEEGHGKLSDFATYSNTLTLTANAEGGWEVTAAEGTTLTIKAEMDLGSETNNFYTGATKEEATQVAGDVPALTFTYTTGIGVGSATGWYAVTE